MHRLEEKFLFQADKVQQAASPGEGRAALTSVGELRSAAGTLEEDVEAIVDLLRRGEWPVGEITPGRKAAERLLGDVREATAVVSAHHEARASFKRVEEEWRTFYKETLEKTAGDPNLGSLNRENWKQHQTAAIGEIERAQARMVDAIRVLLKAS